ncbi:MAG: hypothetical protein AAF823_14120 [Planctomycetota bacterium]
MSRGTNRGIFLAVAAMLVVASLPMMFFAAWFFYDGLVAYPQKQRRQLAYMEVQASHLPSDAREAWREMATEKGWPVEDPGPPLRDTEIVTQLIVGTLCAGVGVLGWWLPAGVLIVLAFWGGRGRGGSSA